MRARQPCCWMQKARVAASSACLTIEAMSLAVSIARAGTRLNWLMVTRQASRSCLCPNCLQAAFSPWVTSLKVATSLGVTVWLEVEAKWSNNSAAA